MKQKASLHTFFISLFLIFFSMQGCIKEDLSQCAPAKINSDSTYIYFSYLQIDKNDVGINPFNIKSITLYVFDKNDKYLFSITKETPSFNKNFYFALDLEPGNYTFTAWGNLSEPYFTLPAILEKGLTELDSAKIYLKRPNSNSITTTINHLFFGNKTNVAVSELTKNQFVYIPIVQNTNDITLIVKGLQHNNDEYIFSVTDNNSKYNFKNDFVSDPTFTYLTSNNLNQNYELHAALRILKLADNRNVELELYNVTQQKFKYTHNLIDLLKRLQEQNSNVGIDWINMHNFKIILTFKPNLDITVTINGWNVITDDVQLP